MRRKKTMAPAMAGLLLALTLTGPARAVGMEEGMTFLCEPPLSPQTVSVDNGSREDFSQQANPAAFTAELTRGNYNAIRETILDRDAILSGAREPIKMDDSTKLYGILDNAMISVGSYPSYELVYQGDGYVCAVKYPEAYNAAAEHTQGFVDVL